MKDIKTAQQLKQYFLDNAQPLVQQYIDAATGDGELKSTNASAREEVWDVLKSLMLHSSDKLELQIEGPKDIIKAVEAGKCTMKEADALLAMYKKVKEIEMVGQVPGDGKGGFNIIIQTSSANRETLEVSANPQIIEVDK